VGATPTGATLDDAQRPWLNRLEHPPACFEAQTMELTISSLRSSRGR